MVKKSDLIIKKSGISGKGVYARISIKKGKTICFLRGELMDLNEMIRRTDENLEDGADPLGVDNEKYLDLDELSRTFNHSCNPNAYLSKKSKLKALRDINRGDEITYDYSTTMDDNEEKIKKSGGGLWTCKCKCGSKNCRGLIDQFRLLPKNIQNFYLKNNYTPDFILRKYKK
ncbi:MAG: SET domain-containing protein-lysine N-methyltransferase [Candidatus Pacearchaeota archaeon]|jgi:hypothetical protein